MDNPIKMDNLGVPLRKPPSVYKVLPPTSMLIQPHDTSSHSEWSTIGSERPKKIWPVGSPISLVDWPISKVKKKQSWASKHRRYMVSASGPCPRSSKTEARLMMATKVSWWAKATGRKWFEFWGHHPVFLGHGNVQNIDEFGSSSKVWGRESINMSKSCLKTLVRMVHHPALKGGNSKNLRRPRVKKKSESLDVQRPVFFHSLPSSGDTASLLLEGVPE